jgi:hypothetical protein
MSDGNGRDVESQVKAVLDQATAPVQIFELALIFDTEGVFRGVRAPRMDKKLVLPLVLDAAAGIARQAALGEPVKSSLILPRDV